eukprot:gnl/TRDRNA2_/TRDRNA2_122031_c0_seq1.p2 gnl/TRDRNA2_/TRDRNA2_122031_c0~~gnl/TRDRNA2_/TRDRNA2_122031_c0_seq1.p2  ORF type:complete len:137 (+),score=27.94 gnl/TRDRNA2_/TRDRNA2_122031_c0_seq1:38-412(+)
MTCEGCDDQKVQKAVERAVQKAIVRDIKRVAGTELGQAVAQAVGRAVERKVGQAARQRVEHAVERAVGHHFPADAFVVRACPSGSNIVAEAVVGLLMGVFASAVVLIFSGGPAKEPLPEHSSWI